MPDPIHPGVFVEEIPSGASPIEPAGTSVAAIVGAFAEGPVREAVTVASAAELERFGAERAALPASRAARMFFDNGGRRAVVVRSEVSAERPGGVRDAPPSPDDLERALLALEASPEPALLLLPDTDRMAGTLAAQAAEAAIRWAEDHRLFYLLDPPRRGRGRATPRSLLSWLGKHGALRHPNAAAYHPRPLRAAKRTAGRPVPVPSSGAIAGLYARTDRDRGVWKAPAGVEATLAGIAGFERDLTEAEIGDLTAGGVNALRELATHGPVAWGARTLAGDSRSSSEWRYVPVRRTFLFLERSIHDGTEWAVFEPNDEPLWAALRTTVDAFLAGLFRQGAFAGTTAREAYFVRCDRTTTTESDIERGVVNVLVGFAPVRPAEFVILSIQQLAGQSG